jgi:putative ABC transport system permease protein
MKTKRFRHKNWAVAIPVTAWLGGLGATLLIGVVAGLVSAVRASRLSPAEALRTV